MYQQLNRVKTDLKKVYPKTGLEVDCTSKFGRKHYCYVHNVRGIRSFVKNQMNRRIRRASKFISEHSLDLAECWDDDWICECEYCNPVSNPNEADSFTIEIFLRTQYLLANGVVTMDERCRLMEMGLSSYEDLNLALDLIDQIESKRLHV